MAKRKVQLVWILVVLQLVVGLCQGSYFWNDKGTILKTCGVCASVMAVTSCLQMISTGDECLVERLGKYHRSLGPGLHWINKPLESIVFRDTLKEQLLDVPPQECFTADNAQLTPDAIVYMKIISLKDACYKVYNVRNAVLNLCLTNLRTEIGQLTLGESFSARSVLNQALLKSLNGVCQGWGIQ